MLYDINKLSPPPELNGVQGVGGSNPLADQKKINKNSGLAFQIDPLFLLL